VLQPPVAATVKSANVNARGRPSFAGETLGHVQKGDTVTVLAQITLSRTNKDEPADWAQIVMPAGIPVWVDGDYIDSDAKTIKGRRVNLRGGPGENYSLVGRLEKGAAVKEIKTEKRQQMLMHSSRRSSWRCNLRPRWSSRRRRPRQNRRWST
jgi:uncharacterized protein YgiM (DUF1202 family)